MNNHRRQIALISERSSAYGRAFIEGIADFAEQHGEWDLKLLDDAQVMKERPGNIDGWLCRTTDRRVVRFLNDTGKPIIDALCSIENLHATQMRSDVETIGRLAAKHFLSHNFTNLAFCGYRRIAFSDRRRNAFAQFLEERGVRPHIYRAPYHPGNTFGREFLTGDTIASPPDESDLAKWLERLPKPVAIYCCDDLRAVTLLNLCLAKSFRVPEDIAILGTDNDPVFCLFRSPRLSSIDPDAKRIGFSAAETLGKLLNDERNVPPLINIPPKGVVIRASTNTYPGAPAWLADALSFIQDNAAHGISAADVIRRTGYSNTIVERVFKDSIHTSVQKKIAATRLDLACSLIGTTTKSIKEIAFESGYGSVHYFINAFTAAKGVSPSTWRTKQS